MRNNYLIYLIFFIGFLLFVNKPSNAQYIKTIDTDKLWNYYDCYAGPPPHYTKLYRFTSDTIINGKKYYIPESTQDSINWYRENYSYREEDSTKRIFLLYNDNEGLIYDFSLNTGDSVTILNTLFGGGQPLTIHVISIDSVQIDGSYRKIINTDNGYKWIEGVGDKMGLYNPGSQMTGVCLSLVCYYENDSLKYVNPDHGSCFQIFAGISEKENKEEILLKNTENNIYVLQANTQFKEILLYNILGEKLKSYFPFSNQYKIDLSSFDSGVYLLSIILSNELLNLKIIKQ
ncbi:MAG: T9SS type A sorting domain-containing protein [Bacteroidales bacterium]|nr:T9SS type A sorting domain-containing protein [Bacteroidales bacterium]